MHVFLQKKPILQHRTKPAGLKVGSSSVQDSWHDQPLTLYNTMPATHIYLLTQQTRQIPIAVILKDSINELCRLENRIRLKLGKNFNSSFKSYGKKACEGDKGFASLTRSIWGNWHFLAWRKKGSEETLSLSTTTWKESGCQRLSSGDKWQHERTWSPVARGEFYLNIRKHFFPEKVSKH